MTIDEIIKDYEILPDNTTLRKNDIVIAFRPKPAEPREGWVHVTEFIETCPKMEHKYIHVLEVLPL